MDRRARDQIGLNIQTYLGDKAAANAEDPTLRMIEPDDRPPSLIATREDRDGGAVHRFDIRLQGPGETLFFDI